MFITYGNLHMGGDVSKTYYPSTPLDMARDPAEKAAIRAAHATKKDVTLFVRYRTNPHPANYDDCLQPVFYAVIERIQPRIIESKLLIRHPAYRNQYNKLVAAVTEYTNAQPFVIDATLEA